MIRKAKINDIEEIEKIFTEILLYEQNHTAYTVWKKGVYPTRQVAENALSEGSLYVMEESGKICASMIINQNAPEEYNAVDWKSGALPSDVFIIHLLCVRPSEAGRGVGKEMVKFVIEEAKRRNLKAIRLDTGSQNIPAKTLYINLGFELAGKGTMSVGGVISHNNHLFFEYSIQRIFI